MNFDFEFGHMSQEEFEEALDGFIFDIEDEIKKDEEKETIINPIKFKQMQFAYAVLKYLTYGTDAKVSYELYKPFKTMGSITVEGKNLTFTKPEWFARIAEFASNTEVYPLKANAVRMTFTFHGLTSPIE